MPTRTPIIGITSDVVPHARSGRAMCTVGLAYAECVARAAGTPVLLPPIPSLVPAHVAACDGFVLTGGDDPRMEPFGEPTHPNACVMHPQRQEYEIALLRTLARDKTDAPVLGICLGMQLMSLAAGGRMNQHLPDTLSTHADHAGKDHPVHTEPGPRGLFASVPAWAGLRFDGLAASHHNQGVSDPGTLHVLARAHDDLIEALGDPHRTFYLGVQWHPERTSDERLGQHIFNALVRASLA